MRARAELGMPSTIELRSRLGHVEPSLKDLAPAAVAAISIRHSVNLDLRQAERKAATTSGTPARRTRLGGLR
jgi:hypothetical protein